MEDTLPGVTGGGLPVANHAEEDFENALVPVPTPRQQTVGDTAADTMWKHGAAIGKDVQVKTETR